jgi:glycosyltransferase involved in cell wall biosynthesis
MKVSVVIPAYNEAANIPVLIEEFDHFIKNRKNYEVIIVDDGSEDGTFDVVKECKRRYLRVHRHKRNRGKTQARAMSLLFSTLIYSTILRKSPN